MAKAPSKPAKTVKPTKPSTPTKKLKNSTVTRTTRVVAPVVNETTLREQVITRIQNSRGRFFGLYLKSGERINAQFRNVTEKSVIVYDRNNKRNRNVKRVDILSCSL